ncbi:MAG: magnesium/cobalt transporter CorA [Bacteroidota bacterium]
MARFFKKRLENKGLSPGSLVFIGRKKMDYVRLRVIDYDKENLNEVELKNLDDVVRYKDANTVTWLNIDGLQDIELIRKVGEIFELNPLMLEDLLYTGQRPKMEEFGNSIFIVLKMLIWEKKLHRIISEQLSLILTDKFVITFQETVGDVFEPVRERIRKQKGRLRSNGTDYLTYALLDTVVDNYIHSIELLGENIEALEEKILKNPTQGTIEKIHNFKREVNFLRKTVRPAKEFIIQLTKLESDFISDSTYPFLKDLQDLVTHATEAVDTYRDVLSDQLNIYHTTLSNRLNQVMKVLTIFAAIFIPLTFIAGVYGTNFDYLPELHYKYAYFLMLGVMAVITIIMIGYFRKNKWF